MVAFALPAAGYELLRVNDDPCARGDKNLFWPGAQATVNVGLLPEPYLGLASEAAQSWNLSLGRFRFGFGSAAACTRDGVATLTIDDVPCGLSNFGDALAITRSIWKTDTGELIDADTSFNANSFILNDRSAFLEVALHELGHVLGLDHSDACGRSGAGTLMAAVLSGPRLDAPQADDVDGAQSIYPSGSGGDGTVPEGANSCAIAPPPPGSLPAVPLLLAPFLFALRRRQVRNARGEIDGAPKLL